MRAVNLIPGDAGRAGGGAGASGAWLLIGGLALLVAFVLAIVLTNNTVVERRAEAASLQTQVRTAQAQAEAMRPYREFAALAETRVQTVRQLGAARFDWHRAFRDLAQVMPENVWLSSLLGTVTSGVSVEGAGSGSTSTMRTALPNPAIEMTGCTTGQQQVARLISRLRLMDGVADVALAESAKEDDDGGQSSGAAPGAGSDTGSGDCRHGDPTIPQFDVVVFFDPIPAPPSPPSAQPGTATEAAATTSAPAPTSTTPAATGTSAGSDVR